MTTNKKIRFRGFTLLETILGLSIFSIFILSLYNTYVNGIKLNNRSDAVSRVFREARWVFDIMERDLENMVYYDFSSSYPEEVVFLGKKDSMRLLLAGDDNLYVVEYQLEEPEFGSIHEIRVGQKKRSNTPITLREETESVFYHLTRAKQPLSDFLAQATGENVEKTVICSLVKQEGLGFTYAGTSIEAEEVISWNEEWVSEEFPLGVKIQITLLDENLDRDVFLERDIFVPRGFQPLLNTLQ